MADYPAGLDPYASRQNLLHHTYSPFISIQSSHNADLYIQRALNNSNVSFLQFIKPYGNNSKYPVGGQAFKITNTQLITKTYPSFPVRFGLSIPEQLSINQALNSTKASSSSSSTSSIDQLFSISSLELLLKHRATQENIENIYLDFFTKVITSNKIVPFETFNHPISQIFIIDYHSDTIEDLRKIIVDFRNFNFPKYFQLDDLFIHCFFIFDPNSVKIPKILDFQNLLKKNLSLSSSPLPISPIAPASDMTEYLALDIDENSTIEEDLQRILLNQSNENIIKVPENLDEIIKRKLYEFINNLIIPHMEKKIRIWDDLVLSPKKSITGRFFSVSKSFFNNSDTSTNSSLSSLQFNHSENYYHKSSPEQIIRKLADWSLILKDFRYAYSTYDLIRKDYTHDKSWVYVASAQEICVVSLLFAQTQQIQAIGDSTSLNNQPDRNTFRKIRHDIIEPYCDNLMYTFKSRFNLKTYGIKAILIFIELLLCLSKNQNNSWRWNDLIERYIFTCIDEFDKHLQSGAQSIRALLYERLGYSFGKCIYMGEIETQNWIQSRSVTTNGISVGKAKDDGYYVNPNKLQIPSVHFGGLTKFRKSSLWYLLSIKEWLELKNYSQVEKLLLNVQFSFNIDDLGDAWYDKSDILLGHIKKNLNLTEIKESA